MEQIIICSKCKNPKDLSCFSLDNRKKLGHRKTCRPCAAIQFKKYRERNYEQLKIKVNTYKQTYKLQEYNLSPIDYQNLIDKQSNKCAICHQPEKIPKIAGGPIRNLAIDHDHSTGKVRGLLCYRCNVSLGLLGENLTILTNMISYIKSFK